MARDEAPPISRGTSWYHGVAADIPAALADRGYQNLLGQTWVVDDRSPSAKTNRTERPVRIRFVYNGNATLTIKPKRLVTIDPTYPGKVTGYATAANAAALPVDEYLPAAGVPPGDGFFVVEDGPAEFITGATDVPTNDIAAGDPIVTLASGQAATHDNSGRCAKADLTATAANMPTYVLGAAMEATTGGVAVSEGVVVNVGHLC